ncbi:hypothetical protein GCM10011346_33490 [Oceanobacillus neutriphilus]|uniref:Uncharacterized protein n=1 Tax=Oceanobacillus neutriphilus TaxID=531815 RepID=A0ABQ2NY32_9BACI|nr:hypothetical protein GCM10011346_33490 [Oceanobacillus neutriphilus]
MSETLTKQITEEVFDLDKVGVGDVVEFPHEIEDGIGHVMTEYKAGVVVRADEQCLSVFVHEPGANIASLHRPSGIDIYRIHAKYSDKVRLLFRSYYNAKGTEGDKYGRR